MRLTDFARPLHAAQRALAEGYRLGARGPRARAQRYAAQALRRPVRLFDGRRMFGPVLRTAPSAARALSYEWGHQVFVELRAADGSSVAVDPGTGWWRWPLSIDGVCTGPQPR